MEDIIRTISEAINEVLLRDKRPPLSQSPSTEQFCVKLLTQIARTSSAYFTHQTVSSVIVLDTKSPVTLVPASSLAEPLKIVISLRRKDTGSKIGDGDYAVQCELEGSTVFRLNDLLADDLDTLVQTMCTYRTTIFGMPEPVSGSVDSRMGEGTVLCERTTKTMTEDWR